MDLEEAWELLVKTSTLGAPDVRRMAAMMVLDHDASSAAVEGLLVEVEAAARRQELPEDDASVFPQLMIADVVVSGVLRNHPRQDIVPIVAKRLGVLRASAPFRARDRYALWMAEALSFLLARRALDAHRDVIEQLWLHELGASGRELAMHWGDDAMKRKIPSLVD